MADITKTKPPVVTLHRVRDRDVSVVGWSTPLAVDHIRNHLALPGPDDKWCEIECLARTFFGRNSAENRKKARRNLSSAFKALLTERTFLSIEYGSQHGAAQACKILMRDDVSEAEAQACANQLRRMKKRRELTDEQMGQACAAIGINLDQLDQH